MTSYLIEASICMAGFYGFYWLFLHREKLLSINRFYLLVTSAMALTIPLLNFKYTSSTVAPPPPLGAELPTTTDSIFSLENLPLGTIYLIGLGIALLFFAVRLYRAGKHLPGISFYNRHQPAIVEIPGNEAYSFFNTIYIGKDLMRQEDLRDQILRHEMAHIKDLHFLDLMYFEIVKCIFWFNPFPYLYCKSIKLQHEYIADQQVLAHTPAETYEQSLLKFTLSKIDNTLIAAFGQHPIQQRLKMIYKLNSNIMNKLKPLLCLPILAVLFVSYSCEEEILSEVDTTPEVVETEVEDHVIELLENSVIEVEELYNAVNAFVTEEGVEFEIEEVVFEEGSRRVTNVSKARIKDGSLVEIIEVPEEEIPLDELKERNTRLVKVYTEASNKKGN